MKILALDQATKICGYAIFEDEKLLKYGILESDKKEENITKRIEQIYIKIYDLVRKEKIDAFVFEDTFSKVNIQVTKNLCWLQGALMQMCFIEDLGFVMYLPASWRSKHGFKRKSKNNPQKDFKTNREYQKSQAIKYANDKFDLELEYGVVGDDDKAEAICIGLAYYKDCNYK